MGWSEIENNYFVILDNSSAIPRDNIAETTGSGGNMRMTVFDTYYAFPNKLTRSIPLSLYNPRSSK